MRTRVKICGITRDQDAHAAVDCGADALGFVFYEPSPRYIPPALASRIIATLPPFVTTVALFVDAEPAQVAATLRQAGVDLLQFHGDETADYCAHFGRPWIKAVRVAADTDLQAAQRRYAGARALLLDTYRPGVPGGTGERFDWDLVPAELASRIVLAGGLTPVNVGDAVRRVRPYAVDVSGGVEVEKGVKDAARIESFIQEVRRAECAETAD